MSALRRNVWEMAATLPKMGADSWARSSHCRAQVYDELSAGAVRARSLQGELIDADEGPLRPFVERAPIVWVGGGEITRKSGRLVMANAVGFLDGTGALIVIESERRTRDRRTRDQPTARRKLRTGRRSAWWCRS